MKSNERKNRLSTVSDVFLFVLFLKSVLTTESPSPHQIQCNEVSVDNELEKTCGSAVGSGRLLAGCWVQVDNEAANCHCIVCRAAVKLHPPLVSVSGKRDFIGHRYRIAI